LPVPFRIRRCSFSAHVTTTEWEIQQMTTSTRTSDFPLPVGAVGTDEWQAIDAPATSISRSTPRTAAATVRRLDNSAQHTARAAGQACDRPEECFTSEDNDHEAALSARKSGIRTSWGYRLFLLR
jgi:hypothetical protein